MRITRWGGGVALGLAAGALALAAPAAAQDGHFPTAGWEVRQIATGATDWSPADLSAVTGPTTVELTKPDGTTGTSAETTDLGLAVVIGDEVSVDYVLEDGADFAAGAVRLFVYSSADADTLGVAPTAFVAADALSGTLTITATGDMTIGTMGLVYDASNAATGTVRFSGLTVAGTAVLFEAPPEPTPTAEPTVGPAPTDPAPGAGGEKPGLPVTGSPLPILVGAGVAAAAVGGGLYWLTRRRRSVSFTA